MRTSARLVLRCAVLAVLQAGCGSSTDSTPSPVSCTASQRGSAATWLQGSTTGVRGTGAGQWFILTTAPQLLCPANVTVALAYACTSCPSIQECSQLVLTLHADPCTTSYGSSVGPADLTTGPMVPEVDTLSWSGPVRMASTTSSGSLSVSLSENAATGFLDLDPGPSSQTLQFSAVLAHGDTP
jgi:hypothetical protein